MSTPSPGIDPAILHLRRERVFLVLAGLFLGTLAMLNILGISRFLVLASYTPGEDGTEGVWAWGQWGKISFALAVGVLPYPVTFLCTDLVSEFYGRKRANFMVFVGLLLNIWVIAILWLGGVLPGTDSEAFFTIRSLAFGAVAASMIAYLVAQLIDVHVFHFWKRLTKGKHLWLRNNGSTIVSQFVDTFAVITITYYFTSADLPVDQERAIWPQLWLLIATGFVFKLVAALVDTPVIYLAVAVLRKYLHLDPTREHNADVEEIQMFSSPQ
ncbi:MAG: queuosine precursor transporter [Planctomycetota bacterium]